jgi:hypothetical protein
MNTLSPIPEATPVEVRDPPDLALTEEDFGLADETEKPVPDFIDFKPVKLTQSDVDRAVSKFGAVGGPVQLAEETILKLQEKYGAGNLSLSSIQDGTAPIYDLLPEFQGKSEEDRALSLRQFYSKFTDARDFDVLNYFLEVSPEAASATAAFIYGAKAVAPVLRELLDPSPKSLGKKAVPGYAPLAAVSVVAVPVISAIAGEDTARVIKQLITGELPPINPTDRVQAAMTKTLAAGVYGGVTPYSIGSRGVNLGVSSLIGKVKLGEQEISGLVPMRGGTSATLLRGLEDVTGMIGRVARERPVATAVGEVGATALTTLATGAAERNFPERTGLVATTEMAAPAIGTAVVRLSPTRLFGDFFTKAIKGIPEEVSRMRGAGEGAKKFKQVDYLTAAANIRARSAQRGAAATVIDKLRAGNYSEEEISIIEKELGADSFKEGTEPTAEQLRPLFKNPILSQIKDQVKKFGGDFDEAQQKVVDLEVNKIVSGINRVALQDKELGYKLAVDFNQYLEEVSMKKQLAEGVAKLTQAFKRINPERGTDRRYAELLVTRLRDLNTKFKDNANRLYKDVPDHILIFDDQNRFILDEDFLRSNIRGFSMRKTGQPVYDRALKDLLAYSKQQKAVDTGREADFEVEYNDINDIVKDLRAVSRDVNVNDVVKARASQLEGLLTDKVLMAPEGINRVTKTGDPINETVLNRLGAANAYYRAYKEVVKKGLVGRFYRMDQDSSATPVDLILKELSILNGDVTSTKILDLQRVEKFGRDPMGTVIPIRGGQSITLGEGDPSYVGILKDVVVPDTAPQSVRSQIISVLEAATKTPVSSSTDPQTALTFETPTKQAFSADGVLNISPSRLKQLVDDNSSPDGNEGKLFDLVPEIGRKFREIADRAGDAETIVLDLKDDYKKFKQQQLWTVFANDPKSKNNQDFLSLLNSGLSGRRVTGGKRAFDTLMNPIRAMEDRIKQDPRGFLKAIQDNELAPTGIVENLNIDGLSQSQVDDLNTQIVNEAKQGLKSLVLDYAKDLAGENSKQGINFEVFSEILFQTDPNRNIKREIRQVPIADFLIDNGLASKQELDNIKQSIKNLRDNFGGEQASILGERPGVIKRMSARIAGNVIFTNFVDKITNLLPGLTSGTTAKLQIGTAGAAIGDDVFINGDVGKRADGFLELFSNPAKLGYIMRVIRQTEGPDSKPLTENAKEIARNILLESRIAVARRGLPAAIKTGTEEIDILPSGVEEDENKNDEVALLDATPVPAAAANKPPTTFAAAPLPVPPRQVAAVAPPPRPPLGGGPIDPARAAFAFGPQDMLARPALGAKGGAVNGGGIGTFFKQRG